MTYLTFLTQLLVLLMGMFSDVMLLEMVSTIKALVAHSTRNAARLTMNGLAAPLQRFLGSEGHIRAFLRVSWEVVLISQQSSRSDSLVNRRVTSPVGASLGVYVARLSCKTVSGILEGNTGRLTMNGFLMSFQTSLSRKTLVAKVANIHLWLTVVSGALFIRSSNDVIKRVAQQF